jgi:menaquinone-specific isochorismate synthase
MSIRETDQKIHRQRIVRLSRAAVASKQGLPYICERPIPTMDIAGWLAGMASDQKCYWCSRDGEFEFGGAGVALSFDSAASAARIADINVVQETGQSKSILFFCGRRFGSPKPNDDLWKGFPTSVCMIPETMIIRQKDRFVQRRCLAITGDAEIDRLAAAAAGFQQELSPQGEPGAAHSLPKWSVLGQNPGYEGWRKAVETTLQAIAAGRVFKAVLARCRDYRFESNIDPFSLLAALRRSNKNGYALLYQTHPGAAFVSVTPERLFRRTEGVVESEALSSTVRRGASPDEDEALAKSLMGDEKQRQEHQFVIDDIREAMTGICTAKPAIAETEVARLDRIHHLRTKISGQISDAVSDDQVMKALHPTAAVAGTPRITSLEMIDALELFDRGWYAGPCGYMTKDSAEFAVAIRSAVIRGNAVSTFAGAGIVTGSDPEDEWAEIDSKDIIAPLLEEA